MIDIIDPRTGELMDTDSVPGLARVASLHATQIRRLHELVEELQDDGTRSQRRGRFVWAALSATESESLWRQLAAWVGWLRGRYPLARQVPVCWWRHPELVEELTALWLAWRDAYLENDAPLTAPADWHGRWLPEFLRRVGAGGWNVACEGEHKERVSGLYDERQVDDQDAFDAFVSSQGTGSDASTQPTEGDRMDEQSMTAAIRSGEARRLGELPDSPIRYRDRFWVKVDSDWAPVQDPATVEFLIDAQRRLELAEQAATEVDRT